MATYNNEYDLESTYDQFMDYLNHSVNECEREIAEIRLSLQHQIEQSQSGRGPPGYNEFVTRDATGMGPEFSTPIDAEENSGRHCLPRLPLVRSHSPVRHLSQPQMPPDPGFHTRRQNVRRERSADSENHEPEVFDRQPVRMAHPLEPERHPPYIPHINMERPIQNGRGAHYIPPQPVNVAGLNTTRRYEKLMYLTSISPIKFSGLACDWPDFSARMHSLFMDNLLTDQEKLEFLGEKFLSGEALRCVRNLRGRSFISTMIRLEERFGHPTSVANSFISKLVDGDMIKPNDRNSLQDFADTLSSAVETLGQCGPEYLAQAGCFPNQQKLLDRLPKYIRGDWEKKVLRIVGHKCAPTLQDLAEFVDGHAKAKNNPFYQALVTAQADDVSDRRNTGTKHRSIPVMNTSTPAVTQSQVKCPMCKDSHPLWKCGEFIKLSDSHKFDLLKKHSLCFVCLRSGCGSAQCPMKSRIACKKCRKPHNKLLTCYKQEKASIEDSAKALPSYSLGAKSCDDFLMPTMPVKLHGDNGKVISTYCFIDSGSRASFVDSKLASELGLDGPVKSHFVSTVTDKGSLDLMKISLKLSSVNDDFSCQVPCVYVMRDVDLVKRLDFPTLSKRDVYRFPHLSDVKWPEVDWPVVSVLIGMPVIEAHQAVAYLSGGPNEPYGIVTKLGTAIAGPISSQNEINATIGCRVTEVMKPRYENGSDDDIMERCIARMCHIDDFGNFSPDMSMSADEQRASKLFSDTLERREDGHYECRLLWRDPNCTIPNNRLNAEKRFKALEKKFERDSKFQDMYVQAMNKNVEQGWASPVPENEIEAGGPRTFYLSHFGVTHQFKPDKVRPVFDLAEKCRGEGGVCVSLNDMLLPGPNSVSSLCGVLMRSRTGKVCVASDVNSMFCQCYVAPVDRDSLRFYWYRDCDPSKEWAVFRMNTHVFGATDSPYVATSMLSQVGIDHGHKYDPEVVKALETSFYVDDSLVSCASTERAIEVTTGLKGLLSEGGFTLGKFVSNDKKVMEALGCDDSGSVSVDLDMDHVGSTRVLGLKWDLETDSFGFNITDSGKPDTMRGILSTTARIFDPLGFASPAILSARLILRKCWEQGLGWDEHLTPEIASMYRDWKSQLPSLENLSIPRPYFPMLDSWLTDGVGLQLHVFSDSSSYATGVVAYLRACIENDVYVALIFSKAKLHPKKPKLTIPRGELKAAADAVSICETLKRELSLRLTKDRVYYWTDSEICLKYLANEETRYHVYVANRQSHIRQYSDFTQWNFCPGEINPADHPSRGLSPDKLTTDHPFFTGPAFLTKPATEWPNHSINTNLPDDDPEVKVMSTIVNSVDQDDNVHSNSVIEFTERTSSWIKIKRVVSRMFRWLDACRVKIANKSDKMEIDKSNVFMPDEMDRAERGVIRCVQEHHYSDEISLVKKGLPVTSSELLGLSPTMNEHDLLSVGGRLRNAPELKYITKNPVILPNPKKCNVSKAIVNSWHKTLLHGGKDLVVSKVREKYWMLGVGSYAKFVVRSCVTCRKRNARPCEQLMGDLPADRLALFEPAFTCTGTDLFGPIMCKDYRKSVKYYGVIFLCMTTMAIHIELVKSLSTDEFILALQRFIAIRGGVREIRSDNGSNYIGAERELKDLARLWKEEQISEALAVVDVKWHKQCPLASSQSGIWERRVRETRRHLYAVIGTSEPKSCVLRTLLYEISAIMNQVPLCAVSSDPSSYESLTPGHFLFNKTADVLCPVPTDSDCRYKTRWRQVQQLADSYWKRFVREYVPMLHPRQKWKKLRRNLQVGDLVVLINPDLPRCRWVTGRVVEVRKGSDSNVRSAQVKTKNGTYERPIQKLGLIMENE